MEEGAGALRPHTEVAGECAQNQHRGGQHGSPGPGVPHAAQVAAACELLECSPTDIYDDDVLALMCGIGEAKLPDEQLPRKDKFAHVRLATDVRYIVDKVAEEEHLNRSQAANAIIRRAFETRRVEA